MTKKKIDKRNEALQTLKAFNPLRNDLDAYLYEVAKWGLGLRKERPGAAGFGVDISNLEEQ